MAHFCGSAGCVIGYAGLNKEFQEQGLQIVKDSSGEPSYVTYGGHADYEKVAMAFFDIDSNTAQYIFSFCDFENDDTGVDSLQDADEPIRRIKKVLAGFVPSDEEPDEEEGPEEE